MAAGSSQYSFLAISANFKHSQLKLHMEYVPLFKFPHCMYLQLLKVSPYPVIIITSNPQNGWPFIY